jgi:hypothetical protein
VAEVAALLEVMTFPEAPTLVVVITLAGLTRLVGVLRTLAEVPELAGLPSLTEVAKEVDYPGLRPAPNRRSGALDSHPSAPAVPASVRFLAAAVADR